MPQEASSVLREELAIALNELADIRVDFSDYDVSDIERDLDRVESLARDDTDDGGYGLINIFISLRAPATSLATGRLSRSR